MTYASEVAADTPYIWWRLGDASGTTATDSSGNGLDGTYRNSPTLGVAGLISGDSNTAVQFDGVNDRVDRSTAGLATKFSIEAWIKTSNGTSGGMTIVTRRTGGGSLGTFDLSIVTGAPQFAIRTSAGDTLNATLPSLANGIAHHLVGVFDPSLGSNQYKFYIDNVLVSQQTNTGSLTATDYSFWVGNRNLLDTPFDGVIDEVAYYHNVALSAVRVAAHYNAASPPPPITIHPNKITSTGTVHAPAIVPYIAPVDGNINIAAELAPARLSAACAQPDRSAQIEPARHVAGVNAT